MTKETSASGSAPAASAGGRGVRRRLGEHASAALNGGILADRSETRERQIAGDPHERPHAHDFAIADAGRGGDADDLARGVGSPGGGSRSLLRVAGEAIGDAAERAAQRAPRPARARWRNWSRRRASENGAAHESRAAKSGQDRAGKPLHRDAAAIDQTAGAAINRKRRLVAEIDRLCRMETLCAAKSAVAQDLSPSSWANAANFSTPITPRDRHELRSVVLPWVRRLGRPTFSFDEGDEGESPGAVRRLRRGEECGPSAAFGARRALVAALRTRLGCAQPARTFSPLGC